jgi:hypothetical protein
VLDHAVGNLDDAALRLHNASRYGEWLNQAILCLRFTLPATTVDIPCDPTQELVTSLAGPSATRTQGAAAVFDLLRVGALAR